MEQTGKSTESVTVETLESNIDIRATTGVLAILSFIVTLTFIVFLCIKAWHRDLDGVQVMIYFVFLGVWSTLCLGYYNGQAAKTLEYNLQRINRELNTKKDNKGE